MNTTFIHPTENIKSALNSFFANKNLSYNNTLIITRNPVDAEFLRSNFNSFPLYHHKQYNLDSILRILHILTSLEPTNKFNKLSDLALQLHKSINLIIDNKIPLKKISSLHQHHLSLSDQYYLNTLLSVMHHLNITTSPTSNHLQNLQSITKQYTHIIFLTLTSLNALCKDTISALADIKHTYHIHYSIPPIHTQQDTYEHTPLDKLLLNLSPTSEQVLTWHNALPTPTNITLLETPSTNQEACSLIDIIKSNPDKFINILINDCELASLLKAKLHINNISFNDFLPKTLLKDDILSLLHLFIDFASEPHNFHSLIGILNHPYIAMQYDPHHFKDISNKFQSTVLTNFHNSISMEQLHAFTIKHYPSLSHFSARLLKFMNPILLPQTNNSLNSYLSSLINAISIMSNSPHKITNNTLLQSILKSQISHNIKFPSFKEFQSFFITITNSLLSIPTPPFKYKLSLICPTHSINLHADISILASFNNDMWNNFSPLKKQIFSHLIPSMGNDYPVAISNALSKNPSFITRSLSKDAQPTIQSHFLLFLKILSPSLQNKHTQSLSSHNKLSPFNRPSPVSSSPLPKKISASDIELLMRNPYGFYIKHIMKISPVDIINPKPSVAQFGTLLHSIIQNFTNVNPYPINPLKSFLHIAHTALSQYSNYPISKLWSFKISAIAPIFIELHEARMAKASKILTEVSCTLPIPEINSSLFARCDRIEFLADSSLAIIDLKTGSLPTQTDIKLGFSPQLLIQALTAEHTFRRTVSSLEYWQIKSSSITEKIIRNTQDLIIEARTGLMSLLHELHNAPHHFPSHPCQKKSPKYNPFIDMERQQEWQNS